MPKKAALAFPRITKRDVARLIADISTNRSELVFFSTHSQERMLERGATNKQVFQVLRRGKVVRGPEWETNKDHGWKCLLCDISAGTKLNVAVKLIEKRPDDVVLVLTVFNV